MNGELFKRLIALDHGAWVISYDESGEVKNTADAGVIVNVIVCVKFHSGFLYHSGFSAGLLYG
ncbi:hypothetical protein, partial [Enterocloster bolteae]|uniref:hypothetical protein n=1 Tax=Enterocloster bolteae TaxID=208479 RepID=UPI0032C06EBC